MLEKITVALGLAGALALSSCAVKAEEHWFHGLWVFPMEYAGLKTNFKLSEPLVFLDHYSDNKAGDVEELCIYGPSGDVVFEESESVPYNDSAWEVGCLDSNKTTQEFFEKGGYGKYRAVWFLNDQLIGEDDFAITD